MTVLPRLVAKGKGEKGHIRRQARTNRQDTIASKSLRKGRRTGKQTQARITSLRSKIWKLKWRIS